MILALKSLVVSQAPELNYPTRALKHGRSSRSALMSVITKPLASAPPRDAGWHVWFV